MPRDDRARTRAVRARMDATGETYTQAARALDTAQQQATTRRYVFPDDLAAVLDDSAASTPPGMGAYLREWLETGRRPTYECEECGEAGDARTDETAVDLVLAPHDPDLSPGTGILAVHFSHAPCVQSPDGQPRRGVLHAHPVDLPTGPTRLELPAPTAPEMVGTLDITARAVFADEEHERAALVLWAEVVEDHGQGAVPWLNTITLTLQGDGWGTGEEPGVPEGWALRVATSAASGTGSEWVALRSTPLPDDPATAPEHLYLGNPPLPEGWAEAVRRAGGAEVYLGPVPLADEITRGRAPAGAGELEEAAEEGEVIAAAVPLADDPADP